MSKEANKDLKNLEKPNIGLQKNERDKSPLQGITQGIIGLIENIKKWIDDITGESDRRKMVRILGLHEKASWEEIDKTLNDRLRKLIEESKKKSDDLNKENK